MDEFYIAPELLEQARHSGVEPQICPSHKDETDTELALSIALEKGGSQPELRLIGAFGSRMDHSLANLPTSSARCAKSAAKIEADILIIS